MHNALRSLAPGRPLREGIDRILQGGKGALVVVGDGPEVLNICSGGFLLDAAFSPHRLSELAKMDGAIVLAGDISRIARANVHLVPNPNVPTSETGTRHRTAERVARSIDVPVIAVSERMSTITLYVGDEKHQLLPIARLLERASQAMKTLERYRERMDEVSQTLTVLEVDGLVTVRDVVTMLQRTEMVLRIAEELESDMTELGSEGRLFRMQLDEVLTGVARERRFVVLDYLHDDNDWDVDKAMEGLARLDTERLLDLGSVAAVLHLPDAGDLDARVHPRGFRMLSRIPRLPSAVIESVVAHFGSLEEILEASPAELAKVDGVGTHRAHAIRDGLDRLAERSLFDQVL